MSRSEREAKDIIQSELSTIYSVLKENQKAFFLANSRFFQGLSTHSSNPRDGDSSNVDRRAVSPTDFNVRWQDFYPVLLTSRSNISLNVIGANGADDWFMTARFYHPGTDKNFVCSIPGREFRVVWQEEIEE